MTKYFVCLLVSIWLFQITIGYSQDDSGSGKQIKRPNIIFILTDDQRWDALGYAGNKFVQTPEMDRLAKEGTYFENALVTTPICAGSRASILTGLYERTHNFNFRAANVREDYMLNSYSKLLMDSGYHTGFYGKLGIRYNNAEKLFDAYENYDRNNAFDDERSYNYKTIGSDTVHLTRYTGQQALDFIDNAENRKPFCLSLSFSAPHAHDKAKDQYFWQPETDHLLAKVKIPEADLNDDKYFNSQPDFVKDGFNRLRWTWRYDTPEKYQHSVKGYYRMISGIDMEIGKIRDKLRKKGIDENTIIIVMGDNGYFMGERQLAGKWLLYDNSIRVPLIIYDPRAEKHYDIENIALNIDIPSTILDFAGVPQPSEWHGKSLVPFVAKGKSEFKRDTVLIEHLWEFDEIPPSEGVRTQGWKYFRYVNDKSVEELYNLKKDPKEINNLAKDPKFQDKLNVFRNKTDELINEFSDAYSLGPSGLTIEFLRKPENISIIDPTPEYAWKVPQTAVQQSAYQVLVASSKKSIDNNIGDIWNSGQVRTNNNMNVEHSGSPMKAGNTYHWKVRIWDEDNRHTRYSEVQSFKMGKQSGQTITTPNIFQIDSVKPVSFKKNNDFYSIDFGKAAFATIDFTYNAKTAHTLTFRIGEQLEGEVINREPQGHIRYQEIEVPVKTGVVEYQLPVIVDERNTLPGIAVPLPDGFPVLMPFRYAEVEGAEIPLTADNFRQLVYFSYWEDDQSYFKSSNDTLNQIWDLCKYSIKATTFNGLYVDGDRERIPYEADAYLNQLSHYTTDQEYAMARQTIEYFMEHPTWPTEWQQHVALMFHADYMYTGNTELIQKYYEPLKHKTLMELRREDGLVSSANATAEFMKKLGFKDPKAELKDITDWPPAQKDTGWQLATEAGERDGFVFKPYNTIINSLYFRNMEIMAEFAEILGKPEEAAEFQFLALKAKKSINEKLLDKNKGFYVDGEGTNHSSLHANMMALAFNLVPKPYIPSVVEFIKSRGMACSVYGAQYLLDGLYNAGEADYALELLTATHDRSWWNMIAIGSTITLEAWDMKYKPNADWNHAWGAVPANVIPRGLWGIQPKAAGYKIASIRPQMSLLNSSTIEVPTINGTIKGEYKSKGKRNKAFTIELPGNMVAEFKTMAAPDDVVMLNGKRVNAGFDTIRLEPGINKIELVVNSF